MDLDWGWMKNKDGWGVALNSWSTLMVAHKYVQPLMLITDISVGVIVWLLIYAYIYILFMPQFFVDTHDKYNPMDFSMFADISWTWTCKV